MRLFAHKRAIFFLIAFAIALGAAAGAIAFWKTSGTGSATTVLTNPQSLTFEPGKPTAQLYPGGDANVQILASNPNSYFVQIGSMVLDSDDPEPFEADAAHSGCNTSALSFATQDNGGAGWQVPPRVGSTDGTLTIDMADAIRMSAAAANACQGATFTLHLEAGL